MHAVLGRRGRRVRASLTKPLDQYFDQRPHLARRKIAGRTQDKKTCFRRRMIDQHRHERA